MRFVPGTSRRARTRERGATTVEFALVVPILAFILFGAIDGGRLVIDRYMVSYGAVVGARVASVRSTSTVTAVQNAVVAAVPFLNLSPSAVSVSINGTPQSDASFGSRSTGTAVTVSVTYSYRAAWLSLYNRTPKTLTGSSQVVIE